MKRWNMVKIRFEWVEGADGSLGLPAYETAGAAGADLRANLVDRETLVIEVGGRALVPTGLRMAIPAGFEAQVRPRSGLALKHGIMLTNSPGTIDSDYRGPVGVILQNMGEAPFRVAHGDRIAQLVVAPALQAVFELAPLEETERGTGGFGSTGIG